MKLRNFPTPIAPVIAIFFRLLLSFLFFYAACEKIAAPQEFAVAVYNYQILPDFAVNLLAVALPWLEIFLAVCLCLGIYVRGASFLSSLLFLTFATALSINLFRGLDISCGCFGKSADSITWSYLVRDFTLFLISLFVFFYNRGWRHFFSHSSAPR
jgi:uncharacterized membrane protein YphA (DoxX/SURF4 family)